MKFKERKKDSTMKQNEAILVTIVFVTSAFAINFLFLLMWYHDDIGIGTRPLLKNLLIFFSLLLIAAAATRFFYMLRRSKTTHYFKSLYSTILENTDWGIAIVDESNRLEFANNQFKRLIQIPLLPVAGRNAVNILPKSMYRILLEYRLLPEDRLSEPMSQLIHYKDAYVKYTIFVIKDKYGKAKYINTVQDQTDIVLMEQKQQEQLKEIEFHTEARESLLANVSHELKTPLNAIIGLNHILENTDLEPRQKEIVNKINASSDFLLSLINDVLDFSKIKHGSLTMHPSHFRLTDLLTDIHKIFYPITSERGLELQESYVFDPNLSLHLDRVRLEQVLVNLINNACKFTDVGYVKLNISVLQDLSETISLKFSVEDTGAGMDYEELPRIFTEFHQLENNLTKLHQGTGLGLPICKHLVENMGGTLWAESKKGVGSTFFFTITAPKCYDQTSPEEAQPFANKLYGNGERILVVEDTLINYEVVEELLAAVNLSCHHAANGFAAIDMFQKFGSDYYKAILMDVHMPKIDGYKTSQKLRDMGVTVPILVLTAGNVDASIREEYASIIDGFIQKPFKHTQLYGALRPYFEDVPIGAAPRVQESPFAGKNEAIMNLGGSVEFYEKHLSKFKKNYASAGDTMDSYIKGNQMEDAKILVHSIKGLAGMLGLPYLQEASQKLEEAIDAKKNNLNTYVAQFCDKLEQVVML